MKGNTGTNTSTVIVIRPNKKTKQYNIRKGDRLKKCINCLDCDNGFCKKEKRWCTVASKECNTCRK